MTEKVMELVQLENGDIVLRDPQGTEKEPLIKLSFSAGIDSLLQNSKLDIARVMLEAGFERHQELLEIRDEQQENSNNSGLLH